MLAGNVKNALLVIITDVNIDYLDFVWLVLIIHQDNLTLYLYVCVCVCVCGCVCVCASMPAELACARLWFLQGGSGHWTLNYTGTQSVECFLFNWLKNIEF